MIRQEASRLILKELSELINLMPDQRFGQLLANLNLHEIAYYEESQTTFKRLIDNQVRKAVKKMIKDLNDAIENKEE